MEKDGSTPPKADANSIQNRTSLKRKDGEYEFPPISEAIKCPNCQHDVEITRTMYNLPDGDDIIIFVIQCEACGFKKSDMIPVFTAFQPGEYDLKVDDGDFTHKIFRGATGNLEIPEIGMSIERGPAATFDFTNVEGILLKMEQQVEFFLNTTPHETIEWRNAHEAKKRLKACMAGQRPFHLILSDPEGGSYISPTDPHKMTFTPKTGKKSQAKAMHKFS